MQPPPFLFGLISFLWSMKLLSTETDVNHSLTPSLAIGAAEPMGQILHSVVGTIRRPEVGKEKHVSSPFLWAS